MFLISINDIVLQTLVLFLSSPLNNLFLIPISVSICISRVLLSIAPGHSTVSPLNRWGNWGSGSLDDLTQGHLGSRSWPWSEPSQQVPLPSQIRGRCSLLLLTGSTDLPAPCKGRVPVGPPLPLKYPTDPRAWVLKGPIPSFSEPLQWISFTIFNSTSNKVNNYLDR